MKRMAKAGYLPNFGFKIRRRAGKLKTLSALSLLTLLNRKVEKVLGRLVEQKEACQLIFVYLFAT
jgi:hypothetical protein